MSTMSCVFDGLPMGLDSGTDVLAPPFDVVDAVAYAVSPATPHHHHDHQDHAEQRDDASGAPVRAALLPPAVTVKLERVEEQPFEVLSSSQRGLVARMPSSSLREFATSDSGVTLTMMVPPPSYGEDGTPTSPSPATSSSSSSSSSSAAPASSAVMLRMQLDAPREVTRSVYFELHVAVFSASGELMASQDLQPVLSLVYEDGTMTPRGKRPLLTGQSVYFKGLHLLRVRVHELTKAHRDQLFRVRVALVKDEHVAVVVCDSRPFRVLSKSIIVSEHLQHENRVFGGVDGDADAPQAAGVAAAKSAQARKAPRPESRAPPGKRVHGASDVVQVDAAAFVAMQREMAAMRELVAVMHGQLCSLQNSVQTLVSRQ